MSMKKLDTEFERTLSNPDNFIMSDSLDGMIDPDVLEDPDVWDVGNFTCYFFFNGATVGGTLRSFSVKPKQRKVSIVANDDAAICLINENRLKSFTCKSRSGDIVSTQDIEAIVEVDVQFDDDQQTAIVMVTIPSKKDN